MSGAQRISESILGYYDNPSHSAYLEHGGVFAAEYDQWFATEGSPIRDLALALQQFCKGKRVLEVAAGHGRWTRYVADVASYILATDGSPRMLKQAEELVLWQKDIPKDRYGFLCLDAFGINAAPGQFDVGFSVNWLEHIPSVRLSEFLDAFHRKIGSGTQALAAINFFGSTEGLYRKEGYSDWFSRRTRPDGSVYEIVDNPYTEEDLRRILGPFAENITYHAGVKFYWVKYEVN